MPVAGPKVLLAQGRGGGVVVARIFSCAHMHFDAEQSHHSGYTCHGWEHTTAAQLAPTSSFACVQCARVDTSQWESGIPHPT